MSLELHHEAVRRLREAGGPALVRKMIRLFLENTPERLRAGAAAERAGNWLEVERAAHSMKSSASYLGLEDFRLRAAHLEGLAELGRPDGLEELLGRLSGDFSAVRALLERTAQAEAGS